MGTKLPSDFYFYMVETKEQYEQLKKSGMAWEVEVYFPNTWNEHLKLKEEWEERKGAKKEE